MARAIHALSPRAGEPFVAVNCAAHPRSAARERAVRPRARRVHRRARATRRGMFELAHGGTLFLDEIGDLQPRPRRPSCCACCRRARFEPRRRRARRSRRRARASRRPTATSSDEVAAGRFREDLYYRLTSSSSTCRRCASAATTSMLLARALPRRAPAQRVGQRRARLQPPTRRRALRALRLAGQRARAAATRSSAPPSSPRDRSIESRIWRPLAARGRRALPARASASRAAGNGGGRNRDRPRRDRARASLTRPRAKHAGMCRPRGPRAGGGAHQPGQPHADARDHRRRRRLIRRATPPPPRLSQPRAKLHAECRSVCWG